MAKKLPQLQRDIGAPALASVAYGEIASSIYFALGLIALHALGFTPLVLGLTGLLFLLVALSYAEGTAAIRETGGAATFVRVAFNDFAGFLTGWALFLDYLIVIALSTLFVPHYVGVALGIHSIASHPGDSIFACVLVAVIAGSRLFRRPLVHTVGVVVPALDLVTQLLLVGLGFGLLFSRSALTRGMSIGVQPS
jgi:basic amino acid/polyamine antiporter, APA family